MLIDIVSPADQWQRLGDAYQLDAQIAVFTQDDATIVPTGALFKRGDDWSVFVLEDGRAALRKLRIIRRSGRFAAVAEGVSSGDVVIIYPGDRVADGVKVAPR